MAAATAARGARGVTLTGGGSLVSGAMATTAAAAVTAVVGAALTGLVAGDIGISIAWLVSV
jgi:hypothetical protein